MNLKLTLSVVILAFLKISYISANLSDCSSNGPYTSTCLNNSWILVGCVENGYGHPNNLTSDELNALNALSVTDLESHLRQIPTEALNGDVDAQLNCWGLESFSQDECSTFLPTLSRNCVSFIWVQSGCSDKGSSYPSMLSEPDFNNLYQNMNQREVEESVKSIESSALSGNKLYQDACFGLELPVNCPTYYSPPYSEACLSDMWLSTIGCKETGTHYPAKLNTTEKAFFLGTNLHEVAEKMQILKQDQIKCYGVDLPFDCDYEPPHNESCLLSTFSSVGCNEVKGRIPTAQLSSFQAMSIPILLEAMTVIKVNSENVVNGLGFESCNGSAYIDLQNDTLIKVHLDSQTYNDALMTCQNENALLFYQISDSSIQTKLEEKLFNSSIMFNLTSWWIGLDDKDTEGTFLWNDGYNLSGYNKWDSALPSSHVAQDCVYLNFNSTWSWNVDDCQAVKPFICLKYTPPDEIYEDFTIPGACSPPCNDNEECVDGSCQCYTVLFKENNCSWSKGHLADREVKFGKKSFLFVKQLASWRQGNQFCKGHGGHLAMPYNKDRHDLLIRNMIDIEMANTGSSAWLGFSDFDSEGVWKFINGMVLNFSPVFKNMTNNGKIPMYNYNTTSVLETWHFYYEEKYRFFNKDLAVKFCTNLDGGILPKIETQDVFDFFTRYHDTYFQYLSDRGVHLAELHSHHYFWLSMERKATPEGLAKTNPKNWPPFLWSDGEQTYFNPLWYQRNRIPLPDDFNHTKFNPWHKVDPNNAEFLLLTSEYAGLEERCGTWYADKDGQFFLDWGCYRLGHVLSCQKGPFPFERWNYGGTKYTEPNNGNGEVDENCGAMRLDLSDEGRDFTSIKTEFWNDYNCAIKFPFVCEVVLPEGCLTYNPVLTEDCVRDIAEKLGCKGILPNHLIAHLKQSTVGYVQNWFREAVENASNPKETLFKEICKKTEYISHEGTDILYQLNQTDYKTAVEICRRDGAVLPTLKNKADVLRFLDKATKLPNITNYWWLGLDDIRVEGFFEWSSGEPLDDHHYSAWEGDISTTIEDKDCVAMNAFNHLQWSEKDCADEYAFLCIKATCDYPLNYSAVHRDHCYNFRHDPKSETRQPSPYARTIKEASSNCKKSLGKLSVVEDQSTSLFFDQFGLTDADYHYLTKFWVSLYDKSLQNETNPSKRDWKWNDNGTESSLGDFFTFIRDGFQISNMQTHKEKDSLIPFAMRCMYGDLLNRTYQLPLDPLSGHHYARSKSCKYSDPVDLMWTWVSTYHLMHVKSGLCLTAPFEMDQQSTEVPESPALRVRPCNFSDTYQHWVCQSSNTFHIKLRGFKHSFLLDALEPYDRVFMGGPTTDDSCETFWKAKNGEESICDERYRPAENLFLVKNGEIKYEKNPDCNYEPPSVDNRFDDKRKAEIYCLRRGGKPASVSDINAGVKDGFSEGCTCAHVAGDSKLRGFMKHEDRKCAFGPGMPSLTRNLFVCDGTDSEYQWCYRGTRKDNVKQNLQYARWCATYSFLTSELKGLEERSCLEQNYFVCDKQMLDCCCSAPHIPDKSFYVREDWREGQNATKLQCQPGYGFNADPNVKEKHLECVSGSRIWNPDPTTLQCQRLSCSDPPPLNNNVRTSNPSGITSGNYKYNDTVTYSCNPTLTINSLPGIKTKTITCQDDQTWGPDPDKFDCLLVKCKNIPQMRNSKAHYTESNNTLWYSCSTGYWVERGVTEVHGFNCLDSGEWEPNPYTNVSCQVLSCEEPTAPPHGQTLLTSYRYLANLTIICDIGFALTPQDLNVICDKNGFWDPPADDNYCQNKTCSQPISPGPDVNVSGVLRETYYYKDTLFYTCNKIGYELRNAFTMFSLQQLSCLGVDSSGELVMYASCDNEDLKQLWIWLNVNQIQSVFNEKCLAGFGSLVTAAVCDGSDDKQSWDCPYDFDNYYLLEIKGKESYLSVTATNNVEMRSGVVDSFMSWRIGLDRSRICSYKNGYKEIESTCSKHGTWNLPGNFYKCVILLCPVLHAIDGADLVISESEVEYSYGTKATYTCDEGFWLKSEITFVSLVCNYTGDWEPRIDYIKCYPLMCPVPYPVQYSIQSGLLWTWKSTVEYTCATGFWFGRQDLKRTTICSANALWEPDPETNFKCLLVTCEDPGPIPNADYHISGEEVDYDAIVQYQCDEGYWISRGIISVGVTCLSTGLYSPPPDTLQCNQATCFPPGVVRYAQIFPANYGPYEAGKNVTFKCISKYWIKPGVFTADLACKNYGEWRPLSTSISCIPIQCTAPYLVQNAVIGGSGLGAGVQRPVTCNTGFWIDQKTEEKTINLVCDEISASWKPENITCHEAICPDPERLAKADLYINPPSYTYLETIVYRCKVGYHAIVEGYFVEEFASVCQENGEWQPSLTQTCEVKKCNFSVDHYTHGESTFSSNTTYQYLDTVTLTCDDGYWILLDEPTPDLSFVCQENSLFIPNPLYIHCTLVECSNPVQRPHSKLTALHITYGSQVTYLCTEGYGDHQRPNPQIYWEFTCLKNGQWSYSFEYVNCSLITCGQPDEVKYAIQTGKTTYNHKVKYECIRGKWFGKNNHSVEVTCQANSLWSAVPPECTTVICIEPSEVTGHAEIIGDDVTYLSLMTVHCEEGFFIFPGKSHQTIRCMEHGEWDQPHENFTCKPIVCPRPHVVWHATVKGDSYTKDSTMDVVCDEGYYISRTENSTEITCNENSRWTPDPAYIKCRDEFSFFCDNPGPVENAFMLADSFSYESIVNVSCAIGFWLSPLNYSIPIKCMFDGNWLPEPDLIICKEIFCEEITSSSVQFKIHSLSTTAHASCKKKHIIQLMDDGEEFLMKSLTLVCGSNGEWQPHQSSVSCVPAGCKLPETPPNMNYTKPVNDLSTGAEITFECREGWYIRQGITSITVSCLDDGLWYPDLQTLICNPIVCGMPKLPISNEIFIGNNISYGGKLEYRCESGFYIPTSNLQTNLSATSILECSIDGTWNNIRAIEDCERIKCDDPGFMLSASRVPSFQNFYIGSNVTYTCRDDLWLHQERKSLTIFCDKKGKWIPSPPKTSKLHCKDIMCWYPQHLKNAEIRPTRKEFYKYRDNVAYFCHKGMSFNNKPERGSYVSTCDINGMWTPLSPQIECIPTQCSLLPEINHATKLDNYTLAVGSNATYICDHGLKSDNMKSREVICELSGKWNPDPLSIKCSVIYCPAPPDYIPNGYKHGKVYEGGYHVTYVCIEGYRVSGVNQFAGWKFVTIECKEDTTWSIDVETLSCKKISCGDPPIIANVTVLAAHGVFFKDEATYKCNLGHFIDQESRIDHVVVSCSADGQWSPLVSKIFCPAFNCSKPSEENIQNATITSTNYVYKSVAWLYCDKGFVVDHGEDGIINYQFNKEKMTCHYLHKWSPSPEDIKCTLIQCLIPSQPAKAYIKGGRWNTDGTRVFRYQDNVTAVCAHGYKIEKSGLLFMEATCTEFGNWTKNISTINCVDIKCKDPGFYHHSKRIGTNLKYLSLVSYTCDYGYFIKPGIISLTLQCTYDAKWKPSNNIKCLAVDCGNPGSIIHAFRNSTNSNYSMNSIVNFTCDEGYQVAKEQDAVGNWVIGEKTRVVTIMCQSNGRWKPRSEHIHCSANQNATTLYELIPGGEINEPVELVTVSTSLSGRIGGKAVNSFVTKNQHQSYRLVPHCNAGQILVLQHVGQWLNIKPETITTRHIPALLTNIGVECRVFNMFDGEPETYWMPMDGPAQNKHHLNWKGWEVGIDLTMEHIIGSFQIQTSHDYKHDVKTFYVSVSSNMVQWETLGPFNVIVGTSRYEFFYDFNAVQARFIRLMITSTALMQPPVVIKFGIYGAPFNCEDEIVYKTDTFGIPIFVGVILVVMFLFVIIAYKRDKKNRWKRYLLMIPPQFEISNSRIYELQITTEWNDEHTDLLIKIVGEKKSSPVMWLRHSFMGLLRSGYADVIVMGFTSKIGKPLRIDIVPVYTQVNNPDLPEDDNSSINQPVSIKSLGTRSWETILSSVSTLALKYSVAQLKQRQKRHLSHRSENFGIREIILRDPATEVKWKAWLGLPVKGKVKTLLRKYFGRNGVGLQHTQPISFTLDRVVLKSSWTFKRKTWWLLRLIYKHHSIAWLFKNEPPIKNLTNFEHVLYLSVCSLNIMLITAMHELSDFPQYFVTSEWGLSSSFLLNLFYSSKFAVIALVTSYIMLTSLTFVVGLAAGKWSREVEDVLSYWQGNKPIRTTWYITKRALGIFCFCSTKEEDIISKEDFTVKYSVLDHQLPAQIYNSPYTTKQVKFAAANSDSTVTAERDVPRFRISERTIGKPPDARFVEAEAPMHMEPFHIATRNSSLLKIEVPQLEEDPDFKETETQTMFEPVVQSKEIAHNPQERPNLIDKLKEQKEQMESIAKFQQSKPSLQQFISSTPGNEKFGHFHIKHQTYNQQPRNRDRFMEPMYTLNEKDFKSVMSPSAGYHSAMTQTQFDSFCSCVHKLESGSKKGDVKVVTHRRAPLNLNSILDYEVLQRRNRDEKLGSRVSTKPVHSAVMPIFHIAYLRVLTRLLFAVFSLTYILVSSAFLSYYGSMCKSNVGSKLMQKFTMELLVWNFIFVPLSGWTVLLLTWIVKSIMQIARINTR